MIWLLVALIIVALLKFDSIPRWERKYGPVDWRAVIFSTIDPIRFNPSHNSNRIVGQPLNYVENSIDGGVNVSNSSGRASDASAREQEPIRAGHQQPIQRRAVSAKAGIRGGPGWHYCRGAWRRDLNCTHGEEDRSKPGFGVINNAE